MIGPELAAFFCSGVSISAATKNPEGMPECIRALGAIATAGSAAMTLFLPSSTAGTTLANLLRSDRISICFCRPENHRTLQVKGRRTVLREARPEERPQLEAYVEALAAELCFVGMPSRLTRRIARWPAWAVELEVEEIFDQTPGPGAGAALARPA